MVILVVSSNSRNENQNIGYLRLSSIVDANEWAVPGLLVLFFGKPANLYQKCDSDWMIILNFTNLTATNLLQQEAAVALVDRWRDV